MLTTKKFIKEVKAIGLVAKVGEGFILVEDSKGNNLAYIDTTIMYRFDTIYIDFEELSEFYRKRLFNLLVEYASTPIDEREEPQKFYLKFKTKTSGLSHYLNYRKSYNSIELNDKNSTNDYQTRFTQKEIDELKKKLGCTFSDFEQIPVREVEE
jgi:hypothetical protein